MTDSVCTTNPAVNQEEEWRDIPGYPGYQVSDFGNVRSFKNRNGRGRPGQTYRQHKIKPSVQFRGRLYAHLSANNKSRGFAIHRLVLLAFVGPCPEGMEACHNDGNHLNNHFSNLRWDTRKSNWNDMKLHGVAPIGEKHGRTHLSSDEVTAIRVMYSKGVSKECITRMFDIPKSTMYNIVHGNTWKQIPGPITKGMPYGYHRLNILPDQPVEY